MRVTYLLSNTAGIGLILLRKSAIGSMSRSSSTPAFFAAVSASSGIGSHAPNTMSSSLASGTKSLISGARFSVRFPSRMVAICVSDPIGLERPRRMLSTPARNRVATAPSPGVSMPSRPVAGAIDLGASLEDDLPNFYLRLYLRLCAARTRDSRGFRCGRGIIDPSDRLCIEVPRKAMHECDPLYRRDPGRHGEKNYNADQHPAVPEKTEQRLGR